MEKINKKTILYYAAILIVLIFGFYFRLQTFLQIRPMWLDECFLFFNAFERNYTEFFSELYFAQSAPPIFLIVEKFFIALFGIKETSVRFLPYLCSIISLPVFFLFS